MMASPSCRAAVALSSRALGLSLATLLISDSWKAKESQEEEAAAGIHNDPQRSNHRFDLKRRNLEQSFDQHYFSFLRHRSLCEHVDLPHHKNETTSQTQLGPEHEAATDCSEVELVQDNNDDDNDDEEEAEDAYPNFSRHGKDSLLKKYLTPEIYNQLKDKRTSRGGVTLEDVIRSGVSLPWGAHPPRGVAGVYAGDAESYKVFAPLFTPLIEEHHKATTRSRMMRIQRHLSNLNPGFLVKQVLDPEGEYILYTRMRLARSVEGFRFPPCMRRSERRQIEHLLQECVSDWTNKTATATTTPGSYVSVMDMSNSQHDDLIQRRILFPDPDEFAISAGLGRDWPDARGIYCDTWDDTPSVMIWCNAEDHLWIISNAKGGDVQGVFSRLSKTAMALETSLKQRGHAFVEDRKLGFLNSSPDNIGTGLYASVYVKLVLLSKEPGFFELLHRLRLQARLDEYSQSDKRFTGIYHIGNAEALGKTEVELINTMIRGVGVLISLEKRLEKGEKLDLFSPKI